MLVLLLLWVACLRVGIGPAGYACLVWTGVHWIAWVWWMASEMDWVLAAHGRASELHEIRKAL